MSSRLSKIRSVHTYVMPRTVYFGWICTILPLQWRRKLIHPYLESLWLECLIHVDIIQLWKILEIWNPFHGLKYSISKWFSNFEDWTWFQWLVIFESKDLAIFSVKRPWHGFPFLCTFQNCIWPILLDSSLELLAGLFWPKPWLSSLSVPNQLWNTQRLRV